jgi:hypothetical protein
MRREAGIKGDGEGLGVGWGLIIWDGALVERDDTLGKR